MISLATHRLIVTWIKRRKTCTRAPQQHHRYQSSRVVKSPSCWVILFLLIKSTSDSGTTLPHLHWVQAYLKGKFNWSTETFNNIDWITMGKYLRRVPQAKLTNLIKLQHGWQHTNERKLMIQGDDDDRMKDNCPLAGCECVENNHHYLTCTA